MVEIRLLYLTKLMHNIWLRFIRTVKQHLKSYCSECFNRFSMVDMRRKQLQRTVAVSHGQSVYLGTVCLFITCAAEPCRYTIRSAASSRDHFQSLFISPKSPTMDRRTHESPMDFEYQNGTGPMDSRSPFAQISMNTQRHGTSTDGPAKKRGMSRSYTDILCHRNVLITHGRAIRSFWVTQ